MSGYSDVARVGEDRTKDRRDPKKRHVTRADDDDDEICICIPLLTCTKTR